MRVNISVFHFGGGVWFEQCLRWWAMNLHLWELLSALFVWGRLRTTRLLTYSSIHSLIHSLTHSNCHFPASTGFGLDGAWCCICAPPDIAASGLDCPTFIFGCGSPLLWKRMWGDVGQMMDGWMDGKARNTFFISLLEWCFLCFIFLSFPLFVFFEVFGSCRLVSFNCFGGAGWWEGW